MFRSVSQLLLVLQPVILNTLTYPLLKNLRVSPAGNVMASFFWDNQCLLWWIILRRVTAMVINDAYYAEELKQLSQEIVKKKRRGKLT